MKLINVSDFSPDVEAWLQGLTPVKSQEGPVGSSPGSDGVDVRMLIFVCRCHKTQTVSTKLKEQVLLLLLKKAHLKG